ncbi:MAG: redox-sensing transcriptional repressor Rex [Bacillota bacterium]
MGNRSPDLRIPEAAIRRLPVYLRVLEELAEDGVDVVSSADLAARVGVTPEQIRKDLAYFGAFGTRGVGYDPVLLGRKLKRILGLTAEVPVALVGAGNLGTALARHNLARHKEVRITAIFDRDWDKVGKSIAGVEILPLEDMEKEIRAQGIKMAIIAVPPGEAQAVADRLMDAGIEAILNFSPAKLQARPGTYIQNIDLMTELQALAYYTTLRDAGEG